MQQLLSSKNEQIDFITRVLGVFFWGGDQLPIHTRYKISAKNRGLYTCNVKVLAWGRPVPPTPRYGLHSLVLNLFMMIFKHDYVINAPHLIRVSIIMFIVYLCLFIGKYFS